MLSAMKNGQIIATIVPVHGTMRPTAPGFRPARPAFTSKTVINRRIDVVWRLTQQFWSLRNDLSLGN
jgi:hypothetical protein